MRHFFKFRVWDHAGSRFLESYADKGEIFLWESRWVDVGWFMQCQRLESPVRFTVQQFTGLRDSLGREIFEGDLVDFSAVPLNSPYRPQSYIGFEVRYSPPLCAFVFGLDEFSFCVGDGVRTETLQVVGHALSAPLRSSE